MIHNRWTTTRSALAGLTVLLGVGAAVLTAPIDAQASGPCAVTVDPVTVKEEANTVAVFQVHRANAVACTSVGASFDLTLSDGPATNNAVAATKGSDYKTPAQTHLSWNDVNVPIAIAVTIPNDVVTESDEIFSIQLSNAANLVLVASPTDPTPGHATARILANDALTEIIVANRYDCWEWPSPPAACPVQVDFPVTSPGGIVLTLDTFDNAGGATADRDYRSVRAGRVVVPADASRVILQLTILGDSLREPPESFGLRLVADAGGTGVGGTTVIRISDGPPTGG